MGKETRLSSYLTVESDEPSELLEKLSDIYLSIKDRLGTPRSGSILELSRTARDLLKRLAIVPGFLRQEDYIDHLTGKEKSINALMFPQMSGLDSEGSDSIPILLEDGLFWVPTAGGYYHFSQKSSFSSEDIIVKLKPLLALLRVRFERVYPRQ